MPAPAFPFAQLGSGRIVTRPTTSIPQAAFRAASGIAITRRRTTGVLHFVQMAYVVDCEQRSWLEWHFNQAQGDFFTFERAHLDGPVLARYAHDSIEFEEIEGAYGSDGSPLYEARFPLEIIAPNRYTIRDICGEPGSGGGGGAQTEYFWYLARVTAADVSPAFDSGWADTRAAIRRKLLVSDEIAADTDGLAIASLGSYAATGLHIQCVSQPLAPQTIEGAFEGQAQFANDFFQNIGNAILVARIIGKVVSNDGTVERGTFIDWKGSTELAASFTNRYCSIRSTLAPVSAQADDRLVIEIGADIVTTGDPAFPFPNGQEVELRYGSKVSGTTTRLPIDETNTDADKVPWVWFEEGVILAA